MCQNLNNSTGIKESYATEFKQNITQKSVADSLNTTRLSMWYLQSSQHAYQMILKGYSTKYVWKLVS